GFAAAVIGHAGSEGSWADTAAMRSSARTTASRRRWFIGAPGARAPAALADPSLATPSRRRHTGAPGPSSEHDLDQRMRRQRPVQLVELLAARRGDRDGDAEVLRAAAR